MNHRERVMAAIQHQIPDRIPIDAISIENTREVGQLLEMPAERVLDCLEIDGRSIDAGPYTGELHPRNGMQLSPWGTETDQDYGTAHFYPLAGASSSREVERYAWPDPHRFHFNALSSAVQDWTGEYALRGPYWASAPLFCTACNLFGMEEALVKMISEAEVFEACIEQVFQFSFSYVEQFVTALGPKLDILYLADDFASQRGLTMSPKLWRRFLKPRYEKLFSIGKKKGLPIWFHSCGDISSVLPDLIEIGMNVWETVQLHTLPFTPETLKREYGPSITFFGGVNTQRLPFMSIQ